MVKEFDVVQMKDGRVGAVLDILNNEFFILDIVDKSGNTIDWPTERLSDIEKILYLA